MKNEETSKKAMIIMPWGRVGSNLVMSYLRQIVCGKWANEPFNRIKSQSDQKKWLREFYDPDGSDNREITCFKTNFLSISNVEYLEKFVESESIRVIKLFRSDLVKTTISNIRAETFAEITRADQGEARWAVRKDETPLGPMEIDIKLYRFQRGVFEREHKKLKRAFLESDFVEVYYEDFLQDLQNSLAFISAHLGLSHAEFDPPYRKATSDKIEDTILNWEEVMECEDRYFGS